MLIYYAWSPLHYPVVINSHLCWEMIVYSAKSGYLVVHSELQTHLAPFYKGAVDLILSPLAVWGSAANLFHRVSAKSILDWWWKYTNNSLMFTVNSIKIISTYLFCSSSRSRYLSGSHFTHQLQPTALRLKVHKGRQERCRCYSTVLSNTFYLSKAQLLMGCQRRFEFVLRDGGHNVAANI